MEMQYRSGTAYRIASDSKEGIVDAIVSTHDIRDDHGTMMVLDTFTDSLTERTPSVLFGHNPERVVGKCLEARSLAPNDPLLPEAIKDKGGIYTRTQYYNDIQDSWETFLKIDRGMISEYSIGFMPETIESDGTVTKGKLIEYSPVVMGSNPATSTIKTRDHDGVSLNDDVSAVFADMERVINRLADRQRFRERAGRVLSQSNYEAISSAIDVLQSGVNDLKGLLAKATPQKNESAKARMRMAALKAGRVIINETKDKTQ